MVVCWNGLENNSLICLKNLIFQLLKPVVDLRCVKILRWLCIFYFEQYIGIKWRNITSQLLSLFIYIPFELSFQGIQQLFFYRAESTFYVMDRWIVNCKKNAENLANKIFFLFNWIFLAHLRVWVSQCKAMVMKIIMSVCNF